MVSKKLLTITAILTISMMMVMVFSMDVEVSRNIKCEYKCHNDCALRHPFDFKKCYRRCLQDKCGMPSPNSSYNRVSSPKVRCQKECAESNCREDLSDAKNSGACIKSCMRDCDKDSIIN
ncbi:hypothetical protein MLD38_005249 [Melastoma candidum]|uniref:Uncharacterized protein n=1 Tax=Melastoma candidum TaxID=119954 RepID=A0ACB9SGU0_9MYRT|nr:hypothetical protein MLD38_005249 [Melastoma candidum]